MTPPKVTKFTRAIDLSKADEFIKGADPDGKTEILQPKIQENSDQPAATDSPSSTPPISSSPDDNKTIPKYPWDDANDRIIKGVNLRLTERQWKKLKFIVEHTPFSIQKYIMGLLEPAMEQTIEKILSIDKRS